MSGSFWFGFWMGLSAGIVTTALLKRQRQQLSQEERLLGPQSPVSPEKTESTPASLADAIPSAAPE